MEAIQSLTALKVFIPSNIIRLKIESLIGSQHTELFNKVIDGPFISRELKEDVLSRLLNAGKEP
jgi:hypothetical protein